MQSLLDESALPFEREHAAATQSEPWRSSQPARGAESDAWEFLALPADSAEELFAEEPGAGALVSSFGAGAAGGALVAALFIPAVPALAFGAALGAYAGVLVTSLWVSGSAGPRLRRRTG